MASDHVGEGEAVDRRHLPVDDYEIDCACSHGVERLRAGLSFSDFADAARAQQATHKDAHLLVVVDNQNMNVASPLTGPVKTPVPVQARKIANGS